MVLCKGAPGAPGAFMRYAFFIERGNVSQKWLLGEVEDVRDYWAVSQG